MDELEEFLKTLTIEELKVIYEEVSEPDINNLNQGPIKGP